MLTGETYSVRSESCIFSGSLLSILLKSTGAVSSADFDISLLPVDGLPAAVCLTTKQHTQGVTLLTSKKMPSSMSGVKLAALL